ncbi:hypothetical protein HG530_005391 [Fusarium avenaceum]|nr:hypothetical protein HG530_005391 [Fusarium avenaceum]
MHPLVKVNSEGAVSTGDVLNKPQHERVAPPRSVSVGCGLVTSKANLAEGGLDKVASVGNKDAGATDLAHGGGDEMAQNKESLATRVSCEKGCGSPATERSHGEDKTVLSLLHDRSNSLGNSEGANAVDGDNVLKLLLRGLEERNGDAVALANVVDEDTDIKTVD